MSSHPPAHLAERFIAVAGNIGTGKSTLVTRLSAALGAPGVIESDQDNDFLQPFYEDPRRWAFHVQVKFLQLSLRDHQVIHAHGGRGVLERCLDEHHEVFATELARSGALSPTEFGLLSELHTSADAQINARPELLIHLTADPAELLSRIRVRDRRAEAGLPASYLESLGSAYDAFVSAWRHCPVVPIDTMSVDVRGEGGLAAVIAACEAALHEPAAQPPSSAAPTATAPARSGARYRTS